MDTGGENLIRRHVSEPIGFNVLIGATPEGAVEWLGAEYAETLPWSSVFQLERARCWVVEQIEVAITTGELALDILARLPLGPVAEVERAFLMEIAAVQAIRLPVALSQRKGGEPA